MTSASFEASVPYLSWRGYPCLSQFITALLGYPASQLCYALADEVFLLGKEKIKEPHGFLLCANHLTVVDSWPITRFLCYPRALYDSLACPYHLVGEDMLKNRLLWLGGLFNRAIPINRRGGGLMQPAIRFAEEALKRGNTVFVFPEGGRERPPLTLRPGRAGAGKIAYHARPPVYPVYHEGMHEILPVGQKTPKRARRMVIEVGDPLFLDDLYEKPPSLETYLAISQRMMEAIGEIQRKWR